MDINVLSIDLEVVESCPPFQAPKWLGQAKCTAINAWRDDLPDNLSDFSHIILSGSTCSIMNDDSIVEPISELITKAVSLGIPILGICYGHQLLARVLLGKDYVRKSSTPEIGWLNVHLTDVGKEVFKGQVSPFKVFVGHFDEVYNLPDDWVTTAFNESCKVHGYINNNLKIMGFQFHPEMDLEVGNICFSMSENAAEAMGTSVEEIIKCARDDESRKILFPAFLNFKWQD